MRRLDSNKVAAIDLVEAAYSLSLDESDWLESVLSAGLAAIGSALFASAISFDRSPRTGRVRPRSWRHAAASDEAQDAVVRHAAQIPADVECTWFQTGLVDTASQVSPRSRRFVESFESKTVIAADMLLINAIEPDGRGAFISMFLPDETKLDPDERRRWQMLAAHLSAGHRFWRALASRTDDPTELPLGAEAVVDPKSFTLTDATGSAQDRDVAETLRNAARRVDRARGRLRKTSPDAALQTWWALMHGRWSIVDWFDSDGRRFVLGVPNRPDLGDPRNLTTRELQVATYAARGESGKLISYRLGLSKASVSTALHAAMRKLGVKTQPELVRKMRGFAKHFEGDVGVGSSRGGP